MAAVATWPAAYETLRRWALDVAPATPPPSGWGVFVRQGCAAWLAAEACARPATAVAPPRVRARPPQDSPVASSDPHTVQVLATMVLACRQEEQP